MTNQKDVTCPGCEHSLKTQHQRHESAAFRIAAPEAALSLKCNECKCYAPVFVLLSVYPEIAKEMGLS
jgi:hypothetical protein